MVVVATVVIRLSLASIAARRVDVNTWSASSWDRWDTGLYKDIAEHGYILGHCGTLFPTGPYPPSAWCGNTAWYPLYPLLMRFGTLFGLSTASSGRLISWLLFTTAMAIIWFVHLNRSRRATAYPLMLVAAFFPGSIYYGAIFPISLAVVAALTTISFLDRSRYKLAGLAGAFALLTYPSMVLLVALAVVGIGAARPASAAVRRDLEERVWFVAPMIAAYLALLAVFQVTTGRWNAWFLAQAHYGYDKADPLLVYYHHFDSLHHLSVERADGPAWQSVLVLALIVWTVCTAMVRRSALTRLERLCVLYVVVFWAGPLILGGQLSIHRSEALLIPAVLLLRRLPPRPYGPSQHARPPSRWRWTTCSSPTTSYEPTRPAVSRPGSSPNPGFRAGTFFGIEVVEQKVSKRLVVRVTVSLALAAVVGCSAGGESTSITTITTQAEPRSSTSRPTDTGPPPATAPPTSAVPALAGLASSTRALGSAEPDTVRPSERITVTPSGVVQRMCTEISPLDRIMPDGTVVGVGWLGNGYWVPGNPPARTVPGCKALDSDRPVEFIIPSVPAGTYRICLGAEQFVAESCAVFTVLEFGSQ